MKNKPLLIIILNVKCLMFSFVFFLLFNIQYSAFNIAYAQPAKTAAKPVKPNLPSIIKTIPIPWPASAVVDEKENRIFILSGVLGGSAAVVALNGNDNSIIKKIDTKEKFFNNAAGNGMAYNKNTKRLYALLEPSSGYLAAVIDANTYKLLSPIENFKYDNKDWGYLPSLSLNISERHNLIYAVPRHYEYILAFNGGSNKLAEKLKHEEKANFAAISGNGDFIYIAGDRFVKFDIKEKKISAVLNINVQSVPFIDEKNGLIFAAAAYKLYVIDFKTFKIKDEREDIPYPPSGGASIVLNPTTNHLFVPTYGDSVSVIDVPSMKMIATIKVGQGIKSIAVNSQTNRVYVTLVNVENKVVVIQDR